MIFFLKASAGRFSGEAMRIVNIMTAAAFFSLVLFCVLPNASWAHAFPDRSDPKVGATIASPPTQVRIWFDGDLEPAFSTIMVHNMDGRMVSKGDGRVDPSDPALLEVSLPKLPPGGYLVIWNVVSRDGHRTQGQYVFTIK